MILCFGLQSDSVLKPVDLLSSPEMSLQSPDLYRDWDESPSETLDYDRTRPQHDLTPRLINYDQCVYFDDIKPRLPIFSGEANLWEPFLMQLHLISRSCPQHDLTPRLINYDQCVYFDNIKPRLPIFSGEANF